MANPVQALLFDLGGVILHVDFGLALSCWAEHAGCDVTQLRNRFGFDEALQRLERGEISTEDYFAKLRSSLGIGLSDTQMLEGWNAIHVGEMPGIADLLSVVGQRFPLYALTNTTRAHELYWTSQFAGVLSHFRRIFASSTIGMRKPDAAVFHHVVREIGLPPESIMFFDDSADNIAAAARLGLQAVHCRTTADIITALGGLER